MTEIIKCTINELPFIACVVYVTDKTLTVAGAVDRFKEKYGDPEKVYVVGREVWIPIGDE